MSAPSVAIEPRPERVEALVAECLAERAADPARATRPITSQLAPGLPEHPVDRLLMKEAIAGLLDEATRRAAPSTRLRVTLKANRNALMFAVKSPGPGLSDAEREDLFGGEPREGTLARVRAIVGAHGGVAWANGIAGKGITYYFSLPIRRPAAGG